MVQPQYELHPPYFLSSRSLPARNVGDATIHLHAVEIDAQEPDDQRVVWEYLVESTDLHHAGRDLATPYRGADAIAAQLPTAMDTLVGHLAHLADLDSKPDDVPDDLYGWARRNLEALEAAQLDDTDRREQPMPASVVWRAITHDAAQTPYGRWCAGQATQHADSMATLQPQAGTTAGLVVRDESWHDNALAFYTTLTIFTEPDPPDSPRCAVAGLEAVVAWLRGPAPDGARVDTMGAFVGVRDAGLRIGRVPDLVEHAQRGGLFGIPGHTIQAHRLIDEYSDPHRAIHLLTVTTPDGAYLATTPVDTDNLGLRSGAQAAVALLHRFAGHVNDALASHRPVWSVPAGRGRAFPRIDTPTTGQQHAPAQPAVPLGSPRHTR